MSKEFAYVYIVTCRVAGPCEVEIRAAFTSRTVAEAYINEHIGDTYRDEWAVTACEVDALVSEVRIPQPA